MPAADDPELSTAVQYTVEQIRITVDQLRESWEWLLEHTAPGHASSASAPAQTDEQAERLEALGHSDRAYRDWNLRHGMSALPPSPAAVRIGAVDAQAAVAAAVMEAVHLVAEQLRACYIGGRGRQGDTVRAALDWIAADSSYEWASAEPVGCLISSPEQLVDELAAGRDEVRRAALAAASGYALFVDPLDGLRDEATAAKVDKLLQRADRAARAATRTLDEEPEPVIDPDTGRPARCPACGRRSLQLQNGEIRCVSSSCSCTGDAVPDQPECGCRRPEKRAGRPHAWGRAEVDQLWAAISAAVPQAVKRSLGHGAAGHGGWQSRDMAGQQ
jgi:hypothetical protein